MPHFHEKNPFNTPFPGYSQRKPTIQHFGHTIQPSKHTIELKDVGISCGHCKFASSSKVEGKNNKESKQLLSQKVMISAKFSPTYAQLLPDHRREDMAASNGGRVEGFGDKKQGCTPWG